jgi:hypothetical protein
MYFIALTQHIQGFEASNYKVQYFLVFSLAKRIFNKFSIYYHIILLSTMRKAFGYQMPQTVDKDSFCKIQCINMCTYTKTKG